MLRLLAKFLVILAAITVMELPTGALQLVAWSQMLSDRIPEQGIEAAIDSTFNGKSPCELCLAAQEVHVSQQESEPEHRNSLKLGIDKLSRYQLAKVKAPISPSGMRTQWNPRFFCTPSTPSFQVPTPPPRAFFFV